MTLGDFFLWLKRIQVLCYFIFSLSTSALLAWIFGRGEGHLSPWNYFIQCLFIWQQYQESLPLL